jgi:hypothetical protein
MKPTTTWRVAAGLPGLLLLLALAREPGNRAAAQQSQGPEPTPSAVEQPRRPVSGQGFLGGLVRALNPQPSQSLRQVAPTVRGLAEAQGQLDEIQAAGPPAAPTPRPADLARQLGGEAGLREAAGQGEAPAIFTETADIKNLLGEDPRWVWQNDPMRGRPDPMLIPWIADTLLFDAAMAEALQLLSEGDTDEERLGKLNQAREVYEKLLLNLYEPALRVKVEAQVLAIGQQIGALEKTIAAKAAPLAGPTPTPTPVIVVLPQWIYESARGVVHEPDGNSMVMVGEDPLRVGDEVPNTQGQVIVKEIGYQRVVFMATQHDTSRDFEILVQGDVVE